MKLSDKDYIGNQCSNILNLLKDIFEDIKLLDEKKKSVESKTMKELLDENLRVSRTIYFNYVEIINDFKNYMKFSYEMDSLIEDSMMLFLKNTAELTKKTIELNTFIKSDNLENLAISNVDRTFCCNNLLENTLRGNDVFRKVYMHIIYLSVLSFSLALNTNDYNKYKKRKDSILNLVKTTADIPLGQLTVFINFTENIAQIVNSTDKYYMITEFVENTDENLLKMENQIDALLLVLYNQQMLVKIFSEISECSEKALQSVQKEILDNNE